MWHQNEQRERVSSLLKLAVTDKQNGNTFYTRAIITSIENGVYIVKFDNDIIQSVFKKYEYEISYGPR